MSRFNTATVARTTRKPDTHNLAGGQAFSQDAKRELASLVATSFVTDKYYRSATDELARMRELVKEVDPLFAAKAAVYARNKDGLRSITHAVAGEVAHNVKGEDWTKRFFDKVVRRPDDATEILAYYLGFYGKPIPNSLKKGLGASLGKFDGYQLAKYRGDGKALSLVDVVNLVHPKPTRKNAEALRLLVAGELRSTGTWESKLSEAGKTEDKDAAKAQAWKSLLEERKIGYLALLRNLRNIAEQAPKLVPLACEILTDAEFVSRSLVFPFQFISAYQELGNNPRILKAISDAVDLSLVNVPDLGDTLIAVDGSGSMGSTLAGSTISMNQAGALFAASYFKKNCSDVMVFGTTAGPVRGLNPGDSTLTVQEKISKTCYGHGTNFHAIFDNAKRKYDSIVVFSDMQGWIGYHTPDTAVANYKRRTKADPHIFSFDLGGYGTSQFAPGKKLFQLAGFTEKTFGLLGTLKTDPEVFVRQIEETVI